MQTQTENQMQTRFSGEWNRGKRKVAVIALRSGEVGVEKVSQSGQDDRQTDFVVEEEDTLHVRKIRSDDIYAVSEVQAHAFHQPPPV